MNKSHPVRPDLSNAVAVCRNSASAVGHHQGIPARLWPSSDVTMYLSDRTEGNELTRSPFPADFLWGVATAGHQNEGDNVDSDTWFLENVTPTVFQERSGKATNGWELWESDLDLVAGLGLNAYRFSVEWARIEPVEGEFSEEALAHYEALVDGCLARGLAPLVTFNHFTSPHWFAKRGAWLDAEASALFARYCGVVMDRFGDRIH